MRLLPLLLCQMCNADQGFSKSTSVKCGASNTKLSGFSWINDAAVCKAAMEFYQFDDKSVNDCSQWNNCYGFPPGCSMSIGNTNTMLWLNTECTSGTTSGGCSRPCSEKAPCLCLITAPKCADDKGKVHNPATCLCGNKVCSPMTAAPLPGPSNLGWGLVCTTDPNEKVLALASSCGNRVTFLCEHSKGWQPNQQSCRCGSVVCAGSKTPLAEWQRAGVYCYAQGSMCSKTHEFPEIYRSTENSCKATVDFGLIDYNTNQQKQGLNAQGGQIIFRGGALYPSDKGNRCVEAANAVKILERPLWPTSLMCTVSDNSCKTSLPTLIDVHVLYFIFD